MSSRKTVLFIPLSHVNRQSGCYLHHFWHVFAIYTTFAPKPRMSHICNTHVRNMLELLQNQCQHHARAMPERCQQYNVETRQQCATPMSEICQSHDIVLLELSRSIPEPCQKYAKDVPQLWHLLQNSATSSMPELCQKHAIWPHHTAKHHRSKVIGNLQLRLSSCLSNRRPKASPATCCHHLSAPAVICNRLLIHCVLGMQIKMHFGHMLNLTTSCMSLLILQW